MIPVVSLLHLRTRTGFSALNNCVRLITQASSRSSVCQDGDFSPSLPQIRPASSAHCARPRPVHNSVGVRHFSIHKTCNNSDTKWEFFNTPQETIPGQTGRPGRIIQDVIEAQWNPQPDLEPESAEPERVYNLERGKTGVFDLEELLALVREQNGQDICVIAIPKELDYADHMVIVTARSPKHMLALGTFIRKRFKSKNLLRTDVIPKLEGTKANDDWIALDLVNIVLHIFCRNTRALYDLETLWSVGPKFDDLTNKKETEIIRLLQLFQ